MSSITAQELLTVDPTEAAKPSQKVPVRLVKLDTTFLLKLDLQLLVMEALLALSATLAKTPSVLPVPLAVADLAVPPATFLVLFLTVLLLRMSPLLLLQ